MTDADNFRKFVTHVFATLHTLYVRTHILRRSNAIIITRRSAYLHQSRDRETESQSDLNDGRRVYIAVDAHDAAAADETQQGRAQELGERHPPQFVVVRHVVHRDHTVHDWKQNEHCFRQNANFYVYIFFIFLILVDKLVSSFYGLPEML